MKKQTKTKKKNNYEGVLLTPIQVLVVKKFIKQSMMDGVRDSGIALPGLVIEQKAEQIANSIVESAQLALGQEAVFNRIIE